ncbi:MAG: hypothetical protein AAGL34_13960 [Bacteroidota bacterium]
MKNSLYRQERLIEKLLKFRWKKNGFDLIKVECYNRFEGDATMFRVEVYKGGIGIEDRIMKHEAKISVSFVREAENKLKKIYLNHEYTNATN